MERERERERERECLKLQSVIIGVTDNDRYRIDLFVCSYIFSR